jgi:hypothetical protein
MGKGGSIQKFILNGLERSLSSDNDPTFTKGGKYISEKQDTNNGIPFFLIDSTTGVLSGLEERVSHLDGTLDTLDAAAQQCATDGPVSCSVQMADGKTYQAKGGVMIIFDDAPGGMMTLREGKAAYAVHPAGGSWI